MNYKNRYFNLLIFVFIMLFSVGCAERPAYTVAGQQAIGPDVNFNEYSTYTWSTQVGGPNGGAMFLNDLILKRKIVHAVAHELDARGYKYSEQDPDLIVNFRVFEESTEIRNVRDIGPGFWGPGEAIIEGTGAVPSPMRPTATMRGGSVPKGVEAEQAPYRLEAGSIFVQMVDKDTGEVVWQGFASGLTDGNVFSKDEERVNTAVSKIFQQFPHEAPQLSEMQEQR
jgi:hypothetical protein